MLKTRRECTGTYVIRESKKSIFPLLNKKGVPPVIDIDKTDILSYFFTTLFTGWQDSHIPELHIPEPELPL